MIALGLVGAALVLFFLLSSGPADPSSIASARPESTPGEAAMLERGAGVRVDVCTPEGAPARVGLEFRDADGAQVSRQCFTLDDAPAVMYPAVRAGTYTLRITAKGHPPVEKERKLVQAR